MAQKSAIEWTETTWNPVTGCTKISTGCENCYAERLAKRLKAMGQPNYRNGFRVACHDHALGLPLTWKKPQMVFVNSMSDLFHQAVPLEFIRKVFETMNSAKQHKFQILTKRSGRLRELASELEWTDNIWMGVTVETADFVARLDDLRHVPASVRFVSFEPLLSRLGAVDLADIHWAIVGGESGPGARTIEADWVREIRDLCMEKEVAFFFKQWGGVNKKKAGRILDGRKWDQIP
jgi:protein gp37